MSDPYEADFVDEDDDVEEPTEDELDEPDEPEEIDEPEPSDDDAPPARAPRKTFGQRVEEVAERKAAKIAADLETKLRAELTPRQPTESAAQRQARLAEMEPWERDALLTNERLTAFEAATTERMDKQYFDSLCARDPIAAKMAPEVERELAALRLRGQNVDRDTMLTFLLGQQARKNAGRATGRAARAAAGNRDRQTTRPGSGRSDTSPVDRRETNTKAARDKRLENYQL